MAFVLLKSPQYSSLNVMGILFLEEMVKARHQLGYGILRHLKEFLFADQEAPQYTGKVKFSNFFFQFLSPKIIFFIEPFQSIS